MVKDPSLVPFVDLSWQHQPLKAEILGAVETLLSQGDFVLGEAVATFERDFAAACGVTHSIGVGSGTDAIATGLTACGIGPGDEVLLPANTFVATLIGVLRTGATPVLVDCDPATALIDLEAAAAAVTPRTRAIVPVHLYGQLVSPHRLRSLAAAHNLLIFEDAAQAHLAEREGYRAGTLGQGAAFSFYPGKNLGALGDGGMVVTGDAEVARQVQILRNYGASRKYHHVHPAGTNSRLDSLQAAVLSLKLPHLRRWNQQRNRLGRYYDRQLTPLADHGIVPIHNRSGRGHAYHLYVVRVQGVCALGRDALRLQLGELGVQTGIHYPVPCHLQPAFAGLGYAAGSFPQAEALCQQVLSLPMYPGLTEAQVDRVVAGLTQLVAAAALCP